MKTNSSAVTALVMTILSAGTVFCQDTFNTMTLTGYDGVSKVELNGFVLFNSTGAEPKTFNCDISRFLMNGSNSLSISLEPPEGFDPNTSPPPRLLLDATRQTAMTGEYRAVFVSPAEIGNGTLSHGTFNADNDEIGYVQEEGSFVWEFTYAPTDAFGHLPTKLRYFVANLSVPAMRVEFSDALQTQTVVYENVPTTAGFGAIDFTQLTPTSGQEFVSNGDFARIKLAYTGMDALTWRSVHLERRDTQELFSLHLPGPDVSLDQALIDQGQILAGSAMNGVLIFVKSGGSWEWEFDFPSLEPLRILPTHIVYNRSDVAIANMSVEFSNPDNSHVVVYSDVGFPMTDEIGEVDLSARTPSSGAEFTSEIDFSRIRLSYTTPDQVLNLEDVVFLKRGVSFSNVFTFDATIPQTWAWHDAELVGPDLEPTEVAEINAIITAIHTALENEDLTTLSQHLDQKAKDVAQLVYSTEAEAIQDQEQFFQELFADANWTMEMLNTDSLVYDVVAGGLAVYVGHATDSWAIQSVPILREGTEVRFGLNFYFSKLSDGQGGFEWKVIQ